MFPPWSNHLCNLYWKKRALRQHDNAGRVYIYRQIAKEKRRLLEAGVDLEEMRLLCRYLANFGDTHAEARFRAYSAQMRLNF